MSFLTNAIKPSIVEVLDKAQKGAPAAIDKGVAQLTVLLPASTEKATAAFKTTYGDSMTRIVAWLPTTRTAAITTVNRVVVWSKAQTAKL